MSVAAFLTSPLFMLDVAVIEPMVSGLDRFIHWTSLNSVNLESRLSFTESEHLAKKVAKVWLALISSVLLIPFSTLGCAYFFLKDKWCACPQTRVSAAHAAELRRPSILDDID